VLFLCCAAWRGRRTAGAESPRTLGKVRSQAIGYKKAVEPFIEEKARRKSTANA
jgi:hypothetical protein